MIRLGDERIEKKESYRSSLVNAFLDQGRPHINRSPSNKKSINKRNIRRKVLIPIVGAIY